MHALLPRIGTLLIEARPGASDGTGHAPPVDPNAGHVGPAYSSNPAADGPSQSHPNAGRGRGRVLARRESEYVITFDETGRFELESGPALQFRNALRWTVEPDRIVLAHCRYGAGQPTRLVEIRPPEDRRTDADLVSPEPHRCGHDLYHAELRLAPGGFDLLWRIRGPLKNECLVHRYRAG